MLLDEREHIYRESVLIARGKRGTGAFLHLLGEMGDRIEGRPVQAVQKSSVRTTVFSRDDGMASEAL